MTGFESDDGVQAQAPTGRLTGQGAFHSVSASDWVGTGRDFAHIGWQRLQTAASSPLEPSGWAYFAHSYHCQAPAEVTQAVVEHGPVSIAAVVGRGTLHGVQYHPEKSSRDGEALLRRFLALPEGRA